jgi:predicted dehydrogenase
VKLKIIGAGSIGNHLAHAARNLNWEVAVCDVDPEALRRMREEIYPERYGSWDESIGLHLTEEVPKGGFDLIAIGTPPDTHLPLAMEAVSEMPKVVLVEKPLCRPDLEGAQELADLVLEKNVMVFTGYDHAVGQAAGVMEEAIRSSQLGAIQTLDVEFREHWGGIFAAHPWLDGPADSYLGFWERGGGASGEHSHAIHLWQHFAHAAGAGRVVEVQATLDYVIDGSVDYDQICLLQLRTENGLVGRVVQDVVTQPPRKWARAQGDLGFAEWHCGNPSGADSVRLGTGDRITEQVIEKTRPDNFIQELRHLQMMMKGDKFAESPLALERGLETMMVLAAAHRSHQQRRTIHIDYSGGWSPTALKEQ